MSNGAQADDIDQLVSSVREFIAHKEPPRTRSRILLDRLILTPELRVPDDELSKTPVNVAPTANKPSLPPVQTYDKAGLEATIAELEAAVTAQFDDWEADEGESFGKDAWAASAFPQVGSDSASPPAPPLKFAHSAPADDADSPQLTHAAAAAETVEAVAKVRRADLDEDAISASVVAGLDEQALRRLVAEVVHQELSGELGERITRNVRKMVRREINRVLTSREMGQV